MQLTDELVRGAFDGIENLQQLREAFSVATVAQREYDQKEKVHEALIKVLSLLLLAPLHTIYPGVLGSPSDVRVPGQGVMLSVALSAAPAKSFRLTSLDMTCQCWQADACLIWLIHPVQAVADCVDAEVPESVIRQVGENEYQAKLHEMQMKVCSSCSSHHSVAGVNVLLLLSGVHQQPRQQPQCEAVRKALRPSHGGLRRQCCIACSHGLHAG